MAFQIDDPDDPRIAAYRDIKERDLVGRQGLFVAEGEVVLRVLMRSTLFRPVSVLAAEKRLAGLQPILAGAPPGVPVYAAGQAVLDAIAGFHLHRGILALAERVEEQDAETLISNLPVRATVAGLFGIANHDNMGGIFRNCAAFGVDAVLLDPDCCDPLYRKAIRVSVGGVLKVPFARLSRGDDALSLLAQNGFQTIALSPSGGTDLKSLVRGERIAPLFGAEGEGLDKDLISRTTSVRIAMAAGFDSLNVATTSGIVLAHLCP